MPLTDKEGILRMQPSGRWAIYRPGRQPVEITSGEVFRVEVDGELLPTRMPNFSPAAIWADVSPYAANDARADVRDAIALLQAFEPPADEARR